MKPLENKLKAKLDALDDLPEDYHPNLNSKFGLIQQSLQPKKQQRKAVAYWSSVAVAASLLLIGGLLFIKPAIKKKVPLAAASNQPVQSMDKAESGQLTQSNQSHNAEKGGFEKTNSVKELRQQEIQIPQATPLNNLDLASSEMPKRTLSPKELSIVQDSIIGEKEREEKPMPAKRKTRYREIDFSEPLQPVMATESVKGIGFQLKLMPEQFPMGTGSETTLFKHNF